MPKRIAAVLMLVAVVAAFGACGSDDGGADYAADPGADVFEDFVPDVPEETPDVADVAPEADVEADVEEDEGGTGCPPLTVEEVELILAAGADQVMAIVRNDNLEGDVFLHGWSECVDPLDPTVVHLVSRMRRTLARSLGGVGLAAPQVGVHRRIFLAQRTDQTGRPVQAFFNPWIAEYSASTATETEGCLSVPGASPAIERSLEVVVDYDLEDGSRVYAERIGGADGTQAAYAARIVQHEYDHLDGILIVDPR